MFIIININLCKEKSFNRKSKCSNYVINHKCSELILFIFKEIVQ